MGKGKMRTRDGRVVEIVATGLGIEEGRSRVVFEGADGMVYTLDDLADVKLNFGRLEASNVEPFRPAGGTFKRAA